MADETTSTTTTPAEGTAPATAEAAKAPAGDEVAKLQAENAALRKESAERRVKAREAEEAAAAAAKAKAEADGDWKAVLAAEKAELEKLRAELATVGGKASKAEKLEAIVTAEVASLEAVVGEDRAKSLAHLTPEDRLPILKQFATLVAPGKAPGPRVAAGNVAGTTVEKSIDFTGLTKEQILERYTPEEINQAAASRVGKPRKSPYHL